MIFSHHHQRISGRRQMVAQEGKLTIPNLPVAGLGPLTVPLSELVHGRDVGAEQLCGLRAIDKDVMIDKPSDERIFDEVQKFPALQHGAPGKKRSGPLYKVLRSG